MPHVSRGLTYMLRRPVLIPHSWTFMLSLALYLINIYRKSTVDQLLSLVLGRDKENKEGNCPHEAYILMRQVRK